MMKKVLVLIAGAALGLSSVAFAANTTAAPVTTPAAHAQEHAKKTVKKAAKKPAPTAA
ncbi:MAG: acid shock protein [Symbiopectobacterium sp.]|uniref:acid shock protein n=1 Tax=Symbiopectobacterium sp. TaxID=2952789 RepID=UPI0039E8E5B3